MNFSAVFDKYLSNTNMELSTVKKFRDNEFDYMSPYRALRHLNKFRKSQRDHLALLLNIVSIPLQFKIIILAIIYVCCQFSFALILTTYRLLSSFDKSVLLKHGSFGGIEIFVLINLWTVIIKHREILWFADYYKKVVFPVDRTILGEQEYKGVVAVSNFIKVIVVVNYALAIAAAFGFTLSPEYFNKRTYLAVWLREKFPEYSEYILFIMHMANFPVAIILVSLAITMSYFGFNSVFQLQLVNAVVRTICDAKIPPAQRYDSKIYQKLVRQKMIICIMLHQLCIRISLIGGRIIYFPIILFSIGGVILGGSLLLEFFTNDATEMSNQYFGIICFTLCGMISASLYVTSGQLVKNESEKTHWLLTQLPWYYMNKENRQIYQIFLRRAEIPISLTTDLVEINFLLLVRIFKAIYSIAALLAQLAFGNTEVQHH